MSLKMGDFLLKKTHLRENCGKQKVEVLAVAIFVEGENARFDKCNI